MSGFKRPAQGETFLPLHVVQMELNLYHFPNDSFYASGFLFQDTGVIKLNAVTNWDKGAPTFNPLVIENT
jgi:hypothetical protein